VTVIAMALSDCQQLWEQQLVGWVLWEDRPDHQHWDHQRSFVCFSSCL